MTAQENPNLFSHYGSKLDPVTILANARDALRIVSDESDEFIIYASNDDKFRHAVFGRDSIEVSQDCLKESKDRARRTILTLASMQGVKFDSVSEEEPGRILHEYRSMKFNNGELSAASIAIFNTLGAAWGLSKDGEEMVYYGSVDATPMFVTLIRDYHQMYGDSEDILSAEVLDRNGETISVKQSVERAIAWIKAKIETSKTEGLGGYVEYKRSNTNGIKNQVWKDSDDAYNHPNGQAPNFDQGIAAIEVQAYTHDALLASEQLTGNDESGIAKELAERFIGDFWMPDENYLATGLDQDTDGGIRQIKTITSNAGLVLGSDILENINKSHKKEIVSGVSQRLKSADMLTGVGIRCRSLQHRGLESSIPDYHGCYAVWAKETHDIANGLDKQARDDNGQIINLDLFKQSLELRRRMVESVNSQGQVFYELNYVDLDGRVFYQQPPVGVQPNGFDWIDGEIDKPEKGQAWTISAWIADTNELVKYADYLRKPKSLYN